jgi:hypothetical protein
MSVDPLAWVVHLIVSDKPFRDLILKHQEHSADVHGILDIITGPCCQTSSDPFYSYPSRSKRMRIFRAVLMPVRVDYVVACEY